MFTKEYIGNWLTDWTSLLWHLTNGRWNYSGCIHKCYSLHSKKYSLQYTMHIIELVWIFVQFVYELLAFGTECRSISCLCHYCMKTSWRHISLGAAFLDWNRHRYCCAWEVTLSLSDTLTVLATVNPRWKLNSPVGVGIRLPEVAETTSTLKNLYRQYLHNEDRSYVYHSSVND